MSDDLRASTWQKAKHLTREEADRALRRLAVRQHGLFSHAQAVRAGADDGLLHRRVQAGRLERLEPRVYRLPGHSESFEQRVMRAVLGAGREAVASHRTAAALLALDGLEEAIVELSVPGSRGYRRAVTHRTTDLAGSDVARVKGIPCTAATRTCIDLGAVVDDYVVERAFECAVRRGLTTPAYAIKRAASLARRGKAGPATLLRVLARRQEAVNGSELETRFEQLCRGAGITGLRSQVPIGPYVADFAAPDQRVVIELDGLATHGTARALRADLARQNFLVLQGWTVLRFTWADVLESPDLVVAAAREALRADR